MSIRYKILGFIVIIYAIIFSAFYFATQGVVLGSFQELEENTTQQNVQRVLNVLQDDATSLSTIAGDWGSWDDTRDYALGDYPEYVEDNLYAESLTTLDLNMMLFFDANGVLLHPITVDLVTGEEVELPDTINGLIESDSALVNHPDETSRISGFVRTEEHLIMLAAQPILDNLNQGPIAGAIILARYIDDARVKLYSESLQFDLTILPYDEALTSSQISTILQSPSSKPNHLYAQIVSDDRIAGYGVLNDIFEQPIALIKIELPRDIYSQGKETLSILAGVLLATGIVVAIVTALAIEAVVINRVTTLSEEVNTIQTSESSSKRVNTSSNDEVTSLGKNINQMLIRLDENRLQLNQQNEALKIAYAEAEEATRLKSEFLSTMSHELRTPLNAIIGYAGLITEGVSGEVDEEAMRMVSRIQGSGDHLLDLINDILDISKIEAGHIEIVEENFEVRSVVTKIDNQLRVLAERKGIKFEVTIADNVPDNLIGDRERISQIIINLLSNGFKFTDEGGVRFYTNWIDDQIVFSVHDTGIGIPPEALPYVFDEFRQVDGTSTRKHQGTGLGLSIVKKLSEAMGGQVTVKSTEEAGSVFTVTLPLNQGIDSNN